MSHGAFPYAVWLRLAMLALATLAVVLGGCQSFDDLEADDPSVDEEEVHAAGASGDEDLDPHLRHILAHREDYATEVVVAALVSVGERGDTEAIPHVVALAEDPDEEIRWHVARTLKTLGGQEADETLGRLASDESELVRDEAKAR